MAATGTLLAPRVAHAGRRADVVLRGATVFNGTGAAGREVDVGFTPDRIADVGSIEIDLRGLALAPGFIDNKAVEEQVEQHSGALIRKPFKRTELCGHVRSMLDFGHARDAGDG